MTQTAFKQEGGQLKTGERPKIKIEEEEIAHQRFSERDSFTKTIKCTYFIVVLFRKGSGTHSIDNINYTIGNQQLHFLFPGQHHQWETDFGTEAQQIVIGKKVFETFSSNSIFHLIRHNLHPVFKLDSETFHAVDQELKSIERDILSSSSDNTWKEILAARMDIIVTMIAREAEIYIRETIFKNASIIVQNFWLLVNQHFANHRNVSFYAEQLHVGPNYLNSLCKKHLNITANKVIGQRILSDAKRQLRFSERPIKEIAYSLGFKNVSAFSNYFKDRSGFTPSAYRG